MVIEGDCLEVLRGMEDSSIDSIVTDPPAGINFMGKQWDKDKGGKAQWVEWMTEVATECLRVIKPGGHALVWSIPRTSHWTGDAWKNAGWQPRDKIYHCFGSGFPKSHNVSKAIDKAAGVERKVVGKVANPASSIYSQSENKMSKDVDITTSTTPEAQQWEGWGTALKPAIEEWWLFRKPLQGTIAQNVQEWGTGALNIEGCRVEPTGERLGGGGEKRATFEKSEGWSRPWMSNEEHASRHAAKVSLNVEKATTAGRWPANFIHDGSPEVADLFPNSDCSIAGNGVGAARKSGGVDDFGMKEASWFNYGDKGSAARFFKQCPDTDLEDTEIRQLIYQGKATKRDRDEGMEGFEERQTTGGDGTGTSASGKYGGVKAIARNHHPTVKPTPLMQYLCRLITPPGGIILDPFTGSGSTGKAAVLEGFRFIGIEEDEEYVAISNARISAAVARIS